MSAERVVVDTNVSIRALLSSSGMARRVLEMVWDQRIAVHSEPSLIELRDKLLEPRFRRYITTERVEHFLLQWRARSMYVLPTIPVRACRDPDDDHFLSLAVSSNAKWLLTYDEDLLVLDPFIHQGIEVRIVRPEVFLEAMKEI